MTRLSKMNCPICYDDSDIMYTIACGSKTPHQICNTCEISMRLSSTPTNHGRFIKCPMCRVVEPMQGIRSIQSYKAELARAYIAPFGLVQAPPPPAHVRPPPVQHVQPPVQHVRPPVQHPVRAVDVLPSNYGPQWCQSGLRDIGQCATKGKTKRYCSLCLNKVCRKCKQCITH